MKFNHISVWMVIIVNLVACGGGGDNANGDGQKEAVSCPTEQLSNNGQCFVPQAAWSIKPSSGLLINSEFCGECVQGIKNYSYDWGDGSAVQNSAWQKQTLNTSHTYANAGTYTITLTLIDATQRQISQQKQLTVSLKGTITVSNVEPSLGQSIGLSINNVLSDIKTVVWTLTNHVTGIVKQISEVFSVAASQAGEQNVTAQLKDAQGNTINTLNSKVWVHSVCGLGQKEQNYSCVDVPLTVTNISPNTLTQKVKIKITVLGSNLPTTAMFEVQDGVCESPIEQSASQFSQFCTVNSTGSKTLTVRYKANIEAGKVTFALNINPIIKATGLLNDTGITQCGDASWYGFKDCTATSMGSWFGLNQDAQVGRDALAIQGQLSKVGSGNAGFDFTKISATGQVLPANATEWSCVRDNHTGLIWEVKTRDGGLRDYFHTYTWYNPNSATNGGFVGYQDRRDVIPNSTVSSCDHLSKCNTYAFMQAVNLQGLCGYNNWRVPSKQELSSIIDYGKYYYAVDSAYFPNTLENYWSSSPTVSDNSRAWVFELKYGSDISLPKGDDYHIRLVRSD